jgi:hypothetical protein
VKIAAAPITTTIAIQIQRRTQVPYHTSDTRVLDRVLGLSAWPELVVDLGKLRS